jgi:5-(carboxyamino)imidazole ribonucleotide synthase
MLGGGQLGRFFVVSAQNLGYEVTVLDPNPKSPAGLIANIHICAKYDDKTALDQIIGTCSAVTTEFENIPCDTLAYLENSLVVHPSAHAVSIVQNRIKEKKFFRRY